MSERPGARGSCGITAATLAVLLVATPGVFADDDWKVARPDYRWQFPQDHWSHDGYRTEWWYFTGHLTVRGEAEPRFGYQFTMFRIGLVSDPPGLASSWTTSDLVMGHAAITDLVTGRHTFSEVVRRAVPLLGGFGRHPDPLLAWSVSPAGSAGRWTLEWDGTGFAFSARDDHAGIGFTLATAPSKPRIFQGPNGYSRKGSSPSAASQYYSYTRLATTGVLVTGGDTLAVTGTSWMDKEFGSNQLDADQVGWDWFSLQLDDGRDLMLYLLRRRDGALDFGRGTLVQPDGTVRYLTPSDWTVNATGQWASPETGGRYPSGWTIAIPAGGLALTVEPLLAGQENVSRLVPGLAYWEGAVRVRDLVGRPAGQGYVELTGYAEDSKLPI